MKVVVGCLYHETNTFNPFPTNADDFVFFQGEEVLKRVAATEMLKKHGIYVIPSIYATALSSGLVGEETYRFFADKILEVLKKESDIDGVWLHLHGSMVVSGVGSGELALLKEIREVIGDEIPISVTFDIHANMSTELHKYINVLCSYRTVPHVDQLEIEAYTAQLLVDCLKNNSSVTPSFIRLPMIICGEKALGTGEPLRSIFEKIEEVEQRKGIATASFFIGHSWSDTENTASSIFVIPESENYKEKADKVAKEFATYVFNRRHDFDFTAIALEPERAIEAALENDESPVFISDSGDNTTAGATGVNTQLLKLIINSDTMDRKILITAIYDDIALEELWKRDVGEYVTIEVGKNIDEYSKPVKLNGVIKAKGDLLGYLNADGNKVGNVCTISVGNIDVAIANRANSFITIDHFIQAGLDIEEYDIISVKQGYLFSDLSKISKKDILALTSGTTYKIIENIDYQHRLRPLFPMELDVELTF